MIMAELIRQFPSHGELQWIGIRPGQKQPLISLLEVLADTASGLTGDHYQGSSGNRQVTLIQQEHLSVIESLTGKPVTAQMLRRNLLVKGINLLAMKKQQFRIGEAVFLATGLCPPCSRMETVLGPGGYNAMRGHGGITAQVISNGTIRICDKVIPLPDIF
jgi:MOSC domain-containing protein YiiM